MRYSPNPSLLERIVKWRRRNPRVLANIALIGAIGTAGAFGVGLLKSSEQRAAVRAQDASRDFHSSMTLLRVDLTAPMDGSTRQSALERGEALLNKFGTPTQHNWTDVPLIRDLPPNEQQPAATKLGELATLMAHAEILNARGPAGEARNTSLKQAVAWNQTAVRWFGDFVPAMVWEQRAKLAEMTGDEVLKSTVPAQIGEANTHTDLFLLGTEYMANGQYTKAIVPLTTLADQEKDLFAAHYSLAFCYQQTGQNMRALERYQMARALAPQDARPGYNCGLIYLFLRNNTKAETELSDAIARNPKMQDAYWNRAIARRRIGDARGAISDLTYGMEVGVPRMSALLMRAELYDSLKENGEAAKDRFEAEAMKPVLERDFITRGMNKLRKNDTAGALADFEEAIRINPVSIPGWQNLAMVQADYLRKLDAAIESQSQIVKFYPEYGSARMGLAVLLARSGQREESHKQAARALVTASDPGSIYQAANVFAITANTHPEDRNLAMTYFRQALREGFRDFALVKRDTDMESIRSLPEFQQALDAAQELSRR